MGNCWGALEDSHGAIATKPLSPETCRESIEQNESTEKSMIDSETHTGKMITPNLKKFSFDELKSATRNFRSDTVLDEGGSGMVYKAWVHQNTYDPSKAGVGIEVVVKKSKPEAFQASKEWQNELELLGRISHPNIIKLLGYCSEDKEYLHVYEYMPKGSLKNHIFRDGLDPLPWNIRLKIAIGAARALAFLHSLEQPVIYRDFKTSHILLDEAYNAKLSDFGLAKLQPKNFVDTHLSTRVMGTYGYAAPEYIATGISGDNAKQNGSTERRSSSESTENISKSIVGANELSSSTGKIITPNLKMFTFAELKSATRNFRRDTGLGVGGFGRVFKGWVDEKTYAPSKVGVGIAVAVKKSNPDSPQILNEWESEVNFLGKFSHPNLVKLLGYCWEDKGFLLVYEYMQKGSLENHLFRKSADPLLWRVRLNIVIGAARGLAFLHNSEKQVIYRDFKTSNILLDGDYNAKLSNFGLAKLGLSNGNSHITTKFTGSYSYAAPEYIATGHLYVKSDVYGFGVVLLEILTGLLALDTKRPSGEQNLVDWAKPSLSERKKLMKIMDPQLKDEYPLEAVFQAAKLVLKCLESDPKNRPSMAEILENLEQIHTITENTKTPKASPMHPKAPKARPKYRKTPIPSPMHPKAPKARSKYRKTPMASPIHPSAQRQEHLPSANRHNRRRHRRKSPLHPTHGGHGGAGVRARAH